MGRLCVGEVELLRLQYMKKLILLIFLFLFTVISFGQTSLDSLRLVNPIGHIEWITCSKIRGEILFTGSSDKTVKLWDFRSKKELITIEPSNDVIADLDVTQNGQYILTAHQNNYIVIQNIKAIDEKKIIQFKKDEFCEKVFFAAMDSLIIVPIFNSDLTKTIKIFDLYSFKEIQNIKTTLLNEKINFSKDRNNWFYQVDRNTIASNKYSNGKIKSNLIKFDFEISNFTFDNFDNELIVYDQNQILTVRVFENENRIIDKRSINSGSIDLVIPLNKNNFLISKDNYLFLSQESSNNIIPFGYLGSKDLKFSQNTHDSSVLISSNYIYKFNIRNDSLEKTISSDLIFGNVNFNCSDKFFTLEGNGFLVFDRNSLSDYKNNFISHCRSKYKFQTSPNGKFGLIQNSFQKFERFSLNDFYYNDYIDFEGNISKYEISNNGDAYFLTDQKNISFYELKTNKIRNIELKINCNILSFTMIDSLNQIWLITDKNQMIKYSLNDAKISSIESLNRPINKSSILSNKLNSFIEVNSDNYSFCDLRFGELDLELSKKFDCSTGVSEGAFNYKINDDGTLITYIDDNNEYLIVRDIKTSDIVKKIDVSKFDEVNNVSVSSRLNLICFSTYDDSLYCYDLFSGKDIFFMNVKIKETNDLKFDEENNLLTATTKDGYFYVYQLDGIRQIYSMISLLNGGFLVKLSDSPYFMCSKDASKMLHYVTPGLKIIGFEQLDPVYNRPDIVLDSIGKYFGGADQELVASYRQSWEKRINRLGLDIKKLGKGEIAVPNAEIVGANNIAYEYKEGKIDIKAFANDPKYLLQRFNVYVNEVPVYGSAGISIAHLKKQVWDTLVRIPLSIGENKIQVSVMNELGFENFKYPTYVNYTPKEEITAKTYFIGIGVNEFKDTYKNLKYCVKDVKDLANSFGGPNTEVKLLTNSQVTKESILALKDYLNNSSVNDKVIISCSSHGLLDDSLNFYLAMHDVDFDNPQTRGLKYEELESLLDGIPARQKLLLLDACNSGENDWTEVLRQELQQNKGNMDSTQLLTARGVIIKLEEESKSKFQKMNEIFVNVRNNTGSVVISAAGGQENALEAIKVDNKIIENGAFTFSILECLDQNIGKYLKVNTLKQYAEKRVEEITKGKQKPTSRQETMEVDWNVR